jgi:phosphopantothenate-cysteine ligase
MNVLITAGGTTEQIDRVRGISNMSTGKLGGYIADAFSVYPEVKNILHICGKNAVLPETDKAEAVRVHDVKSLEAAVRKALSEQSFEIIVHAMAVSDYRVKRVTSAANLAGCLMRHAAFCLNEEISASDISGLLENAQTVVGASGKISSDIEDLVLLMEKTPKIISLFKALSPDSLLVGFKLLDHAAHEDLLCAAYRVMRENGCEFILANDLKDIEGDLHTGYLIDRLHNVRKFETKQEIARAIAESAISRRRNE